MKPYPMERVEAIIRKGTVDDVTQLASLAKITFVESFSIIPPEKLHAYVDAVFMPELLHAQLSGERAHCVVATNEERLIGYAWIRAERPPVGHLSGNIMELQRLYVAAAYQHLGIGGKLLNTSINVAKELGASAIWLAVWQKNKKAQQFYKRHEFITLGRFIHRISGSRFIGVVMSRNDI